MRREIVLPMVLVLCLLTSLSVGIHPAKANGPPYVDFEVTNGPPLTGSPPYNVTVSVGQNVEFAAIPLFGTPPYSYQWSTEAWKSNPLDMMFTPSVDVPGATFQKFEYSEATPGSYEICVEINDSDGNTLDASGPIVTVQALNNELKTPSPSPSSSNPPLDTNSSVYVTLNLASIAPTVSVSVEITASILAITVIIIAAAVLLFKKREKKR